MLKVLNNILAPFEAFNLENWLSYARKPISAVAKTIPRGIVLVSWDAIFPLRDCWAPGFQGRAWILSTLECLYAAQNFAEKWGTDFIIQFQGDRNRPRKILVWWPLEEDYTNKRERPKETLPRETIKEICPTTNSDPIKNRYPSKKKDLELRRENTKKKDPNKEMDPWNWSSYEKEITIKRTHREDDSYPWLRIHWRRIIQTLVFYRCSLGFTVASPSGWPSENPSASDFP